MKSAPFRFDAAEHLYIALDTGEIVPNITRMMDAAGLIDDRWYTEESCERGKQVHRLTANYDMGALDMAALVSPYRPYLLGHVEVVKIARPEFYHVEVGAVHRTLRFGGRPDRVLKVYDRRAVWEIKSGDPEKSHPVQTALQAILAAEELDLPARHVARYCEYLKPTGRYKVEEHKHPRDFDFAYAIIDGVTKGITDLPRRLRGEFREYYPKAA
jgi:hypothetical protein